MVAATQGPGHKRNKGKFPEGSLVFSATRKEKFDRCNRLWWLTEGGPATIDEPQSPHLTFGTVLHAVIERWLKAPLLGIGDAALYPDGWASVPNRDGTSSTLALGEQALIKELFQKAVDEGVIARLPGQVIEHNFVRKVTEGVYIDSTVDLLTLEGIVDHKTTKAMKWAKSADALKTNAQMLVYAVEFLELKRERGEPFPEKILLQHNVFCKDPNDKRIRVTKAYVTPKEVLAFWHTVITETVPAMKLVTKVRNWYEVPGPENPSVACNAYGGCFARGLCSRRETIEQLTSRLKPQPTQPTEGVRTMSLLDTLRAKNPAAAAQAAPVAARVPIPLNPSQLPSKEQAVSAKAIVKTNIGAPPEAPTPPPWAVGSCTACEGSGFNTKGNPCRICDQTRSLHKGITSGMFDLTTDEQGTISWRAKTSAEATLAALGYVEQGDGEHDATGDDEVAVAVREPAPAPAPAAAPVKRGPGRPRKDGSTPPAAAPAPTPGPVDEPPESIEELVEEEQPPVRRGPGRPPKGEERSLPASISGVAPDAFVMYLGCRCLSRNQDNEFPEVQMEELVALFGTSIAKSVKMASFYELDVWKRRDALAAAAPQVGTRCAGRVIMVNQITQENQGLVEALMARAAEVFVADGFFAKGGRA